MAHIIKCKLANAGLGYHFDRSSDHHSNGNIDPARSARNYVLRPAFRPADWSSAPLRRNVEARISEALHGRKPRKDAVAFFVLTVTAPANLRPGDEEEFFAAVCGYAGNEFGAYNLMPGYVHMDETTPHIHLPVVPVTPDGRLCYGDVVPRETYRRMHADLGAHVDRSLGYHVDVMLGDADKRARALSHVPHGEFAAATDVLDGELAARRAAVEAETARLGELRDACRDAEGALDGLQQRLEALMERLRVFVRDYLLPPFDAAHRAVRERGVAEFFNDMDEAEREFFDEAQEIALETRRTRERTKGMQR